jgi:hypothetical protein
MITPMMDGGRDVLRTGLGVQELYDVFRDPVAVRRSGELSPKSRGRPELRGANVSNLRAT